MNMRKKIRLSVGIGAVLCAALTLTACGSGDKNAPDKTTLEQDLTSNLTSYKEFLSLGSYEIEQSMTEDSSYTATIDIVAEAASGCAEYQFTADVIYTKYDQGWELDSCELTEDGYEIIEYPTEIEVYDSENSRGDEVATKIIDVTKYDQEENTVVHTEPYEDVEDQYSESGNISTYYEYNYIYDIWETSSLAPHRELLSFKFNKNIEGNWMLLTREDYTATISNVTDTSFDIYDSYLERYFHATLDSENMGDFIVTDSDGYEYKGYFTKQYDSAQYDVDYEGVYFMIQGDGSAARPGITSAISFDPAK